MDREITDGQMEDDCLSQSRAPRSPDRKALRSRSRHEVKVKA